jgi:hypothetical protein
MATSPGSGPFSRIDSGFVRLQEQESGDPGFRRMEETGYAKQNQRAITEA